MSEAIGEFFNRIVGAELSVFICSMIPVVELRGAIPLGAGFQVPWWLCYMLAVVGNMLPVPIILLFVKKVLTWMAGDEITIFKKTVRGSRVNFFNKIARKLFAKAEKNRPKIEKYGFWGIAIFVAIPLPGTGAWTGSLVAALFDMKFWKSFLSALIGVMGAGVIMTLVSYGVFEAIARLF